MQIGAAIAVAASQKELADILHSIGQSSFRIQASFFNNLGLPFIIILIYMLEHKAV